MKKGLRRKRRRPFFMTLFLYLDVKLDRLDHVFRRKYRIEILLREDVMFKNEVLDALSCRHGFLGDPCRILVADHRVEGCNDSEA